MTCFSRFEEQPVVFCRFRFEKKLPNVEADFKKFVQLVFENELVGFTSSVFSYETSEPPISGDNNIYVLVCCTLDCIRKPEVCDKLMREFSNPEDRKKTIVIVLGDLLGKSVTGDEASMKAFKEFCSQKDLLCLVKSKRFYKKGRLMKKEWNPLVKALKTYRTSLIQKPQDIGGEAAKQRISTLFPSLFGRILSIVMNITEEQQFVGIFFNENN